MNFLHTLNHATLFLVLLACHFIGDFVISKDTVSVSRVVKGVQVSEVDSPYASAPWFYWLAGHAATHGLAVGFVFQSGVIGVLEFVTHFLFDYATTVFGRITLHQDQMFHLWSKVVWIIVAHALGVIP
jgi:hypothetical protein